MSGALGGHRRFSKPAFVAFVGIIVASPAYGKCTGGGLRFLGTAADQSKTFWLSGTLAGSYRLESAQGNQTVDAWAMERRGLHLSTSPNVSSGNGGTHKLYDTTDPQECLLDTQNQKGGFTIPPDINLPAVTLPGRVVPPIGNLFPGFGRPTLPGRPKPPTVTRPPTGLTPSLPGGVRPPIATLPPGGLMPSVPTRPPTGLTPTLPGAVQPPIATLPPSGLTPTVPGAVRPPIATLPPGGLTPTLPGAVQPPIATLPPGGLTPTVPGAVQPPIATLPPGGLTPTVPGGVKPPIATLPPGGLTPTLPGGVQPPIATLPPGGYRPGLPSVTPPIAARPPWPDAQPVQDRRAREQAARADPCRNPRTRTFTTAEGRVVRCPDPDRKVITASPPDDGPALAVPLTPGRDLHIQSPWNAWAETNVIGVSDRRYGLDLKTLAGTVSAGLDNRLTNDVVAGLSVAFQNSQTVGFDNALRSDTKGWSIGPYLAVRLSPHLAVDGSVNYGRNKNDLQLAILSGSSTPQVLSASVNLHGQFDYGPHYIRPKISMFYSHVWTNAYDMVGTLFGLPIKVPFPATEFDSGVAQLSSEFSRLFTLSDGTSIMPYIEPSVYYGFLRPNGGEILTGDLKPAVPSAWRGALRGGVRMSLTNSMLIEASAGYLSVGHSDLNAWEGRLRISLGF